MIKNKILSVKLDLTQLSSKLSQVNWVHAAHNLCCSSAATAELALKPHFKQCEFARFHLIHHPHGEGFS
eukprot:m.49878 g.49878  ORF g.49878 m.49878 type:complete len:69 (+) comp10635_c0_seq2:1851-2057(+)